ncbi:hypothetical protein RHSIM_Rhsim06G0076000 [Rhododendron simsii]|uniref:Uncharacterized protein n=1 Tax=Rhododendron simsii TaxID=118357 RepID=A0A834GSG6_RHOSS|nr:hypothetical protein RHSIM_Rhsim06G0076000 [Rhododendron simsii]
MGRFPEDDNIYYTMVSVNRNDEEELNQPLVDSTSTSPSSGVAQGQTDQPKEEDYREKLDLKSKVWIESKKLWHIVGPSIFSRVATFSMNIITIAFAGHLGDLELASLSIANNVIVGFNFGLLSTGAAAAVDWEKEMK